MTKENEEDTRHGNEKDFDYNVFDALMQFKVSKEFCADYMKVSKNTIDRKLKKDFNVTFSEYSVVKMARTGYKLQQKAIEMALSGNTVMMIFALKNLAEWSDKVENKITASEIKIEISQDDANL